MLVLTTRQEAALLALLTGHLTLEQLAEVNALHADLALRQATREHLDDLSRQSQETTR